MKTSSFRVGLIYENFNITILICQGSADEVRQRMAAALRRWCTQKKSRLQQCSSGFFFTPGKIHVLERWMEDEFPFLHWWFWGEPADDFPGCKWTGSIANATTYKNWWVFSLKFQNLRSFSDISFLKNRTLQCVWVNCSIWPKTHIWIGFQEAWWASPNMRSPGRQSLGISWTWRAPVQKLKWVSGYGWSKVLDIRDAINPPQSV